MGDVCGGLSLGFSISVFDCSKLFLSIKRKNPLSDFDWKFCKEQAMIAIFLPGKRKKILD
jgi:hypothetical protein